MLFSKNTFNTSSVLAETQCMASRRPTMCEQTPSTRAVTFKVHRPKNGRTRVNASLRAQANLFGLRRRCPSPAQATLIVTKHAISSNTTTTAVRSPVGSTRASPSPKWVRQPNVAPPIVSRETTISTTARAQQATRVNREPTRTVEVTCRISRCARKSLYQAKTHRIVS